MDVVRGVYLKGGGAAPYAPNVAALAVYAVAVYATAWLVLRKRVG